MKIANNEPCNNSALWRATECHIRYSRYTFKIFVGQSNSDLGLDRATMIKLTDEVVVCTPTKKSGPNTRITFLPSLKIELVVCTFICRSITKLRSWTPPFLKRNWANYMWQNEYAHHENLTNNNDIIHGRFCHKKWRNDFCKQKINCYPLGKSPSDIVFIHAPVSVDQIFLNFYMQN